MGHGKGSKELSLARAELEILTKQQEGYSKAVITGSGTYEDFVQQIKNQNTELETAGALTLSLTDEEQALQDLRTGEIIPTREEFEDLRNQYIENMGVEWEKTKELIEKGEEEIVQIEARVGALQNATNEQKRLAIERALAEEEAKNRIISDLEDQELKAKALYAKITGHFDNELEARIDLEEKAAMKSLEALNLNETEKFAVSKAFLINMKQSMQNIKERERAKYKDCYKCYRSSNTLI